MMCQQVSCEVLCRASYGSQARHYFLRRDEAAKVTSKREIYCKLLGSIFLEIHPAGR